MGIVTRKIDLINQAQDLINLFHRGQKLNSDSVWSDMVNALLREAEQNGMNIDDGVFVELANVCTTYVSNGREPFLIPKDGISVGDFVKGFVEAQVYPPLNGSLENMPPADFFITKGNNDFDRYYYLGVNIIEATMPITVEELVEVYKRIKEGYVPKVYNTYAEAEADKE